MKKTMMFLTFAGISSVMVILPAVASAGTPVVDRQNVNAAVTFTGTFGLATLGGENEPTFTCEGENHVEGSLTYAAGAISSSKGTITLDYTNCHINVVGFTKKCKTSAAPLNNTIAVSNIPLELTYATDNKTKPAVKLGPLNVTLECEGAAAPVTVTGSMIGTVTSPGCGGTSNKATITIESEGGHQRFRQITGTGETFETRFSTGMGGEMSGAASTLITVAFSQNITLTCV